MPLLDLRKEFRDTRLGVGGGQEAEVGLDQDSEDLSALETHDQLLRLRFGSSGSRPQVPSSSRVEDGEESLENGQLVILAAFTITIFGQGIFGNRSGE